MYFYEITMKNWHYFMLAWIVELALTIGALVKVAYADDKECGDDEVTEPRAFLWLDLAFSVVAFATAFNVFKKDRENSPPQRGVAMFVFVLAATCATVSTAIVLGMLTVSCLSADDDLSDVFYVVVAALFFDVVTTALAHAIEKKRKDQPFNYLRQRGIRF